MRTRIFLAVTAMTASTLVAGITSASAESTIAADVPVSSTLVAAPSQADESAAVGSRWDYQRGYSAGYRSGFSDARRDCNRGSYGRRDRGRITDYLRGYRAGYGDGYSQGYDRFCGGWRR